MTSSLEGILVLPLGVSARQRGLGRLRSRFLYPGAPISPGLRKAQPAGVEGNPPPLHPNLCCALGSLVPAVPAAPWTICSSQRTRLISGWRLLNTQGITPFGSGLASVPAFSPFLCVPHGSGWGTLLSAA